MIGLILCGGQSSRMESDKGMLKNKDSISWAQLAYDKLSLLQMPVYISVNANQTQYAEIFPEELLIKDNPAIAVKGPLLGLLSAHIQFPEEDIFMLACDMPLMTFEVLANLRSNYAYSAKEVFVYRNHDRAEPLCAIYTTKALKNISKSINETFSLKYFLQSLDVAFINIPEAYASAFSNFNFQEQITNLR